MVKFIIVVLGIVILIFYGVGRYSDHKPDIPGFHWNGSTLYNANGVEVAAVVSFPLNVESSQACIFETPSVSFSKTGCTYWETGQQAYNYVKHVFTPEVRP